MKRTVFLATVTLLVFLGCATSAAAQVKQVQMHIAGYLCGN
jgi:outer membrane lipoprotein-sorting protein